MRSILLIIFLLISTVLSAQEQKVEVYRVDNEGVLELHARNKNIFPVTVELEAKYSNLRPSKRIPVTDVLAANESKKLVEFKPVDDTKAWEFSTNYVYFMGSIRAQHNNRFEYRLPYQLGREFRVSQGYHGTFSHTDKIAYSIDFQLDEGTEVYAARSGVVVDIENKYKEGGDDEQYLDKANFVTILHNDGSFADYSHLRHNGVNVRVGQVVRTGQLLGYSGATGYASGPHLHFNVKMVTGDGSFQTIPVKFKTSQGSIRLEEGKTYKAL
jgi:murein DD-endopeptidase MepM/ murein hydrolase activator NlpD